MELRWQIPQIFVRYWMDWGTCHSIRWNCIGRPFLHCNKTRRRHEQSWKLSLNAEGFQGPLNQRSDFKEVKQTCKKIQRSLEVETNLFIQSNKSNRSAINSLKALMNTIIDLKLLQDGRYYPSSTAHSSSSSSSRWQPSSDLRSTWNWDSCESSSWSEQWICSLTVPEWVIFSLAGNLISWQSTAGANSTPSAHTFFSCTVCQRACPSLLSQLYSHLVTWRHTLTPRTRVAQGITEHSVSVLRQKTVTPRRAVSYVTPHLITPSTGTPSSHVLHAPVNEHKPCGDPRCNPSGALAEPRPFTVYEAKQPAENQDHRHFTEDKHFTEHEDSRVNPCPSTNRSQRRAKGEGAWGHRGIGR